MRIKQILAPSESWLVCFDDEGKELSEPVVMWALVQESNNDIVVGLVPGDSACLVSAENASNFVGYRRPRDKPLVGVSNNRSHPGPAVGSRVGFVRDNVYFEGEVVGEMKQPHPAHDMERMLCVRTAGGECYVLESELER